MSTLLADISAGPHGSWPIAAEADGMAWAGLILLLPLLSLIGCGICWLMQVRSKAPAMITVISLAGAFVTTLALFLQYESPVVIHLFDWIRLSWSSADGASGGFAASFALYVDSLTLLWMLFVTGLGTLIALYASEYMEGDLGRGYARFFAGVSIFLFAMGCLVMGDNLVLLYLGWEGVGFASYWLIGYFYTRPEAVAAAKKAFIVNRIGDVGLALAIYLCWHVYGTVEYAALFEAIREAGSAAGDAERGGWAIAAIPFLLMLGAFGKSAQLPLYVWLPDAMEGPTPVSALIHAATMVTAGVYLLARLFPLLELHPAAPLTVAWVGGLTALLAATIGMAQYDIKRIMAYSTVSQLGFMFLGVGAFTTFGAAYHVFTHAFFKAVLFLTCGAIMHGFAGQLDLRRLSGLRHMDGWRIVAWTMLIGCLCLAGFPFTSGYFSKDAILAEVFIHENPQYRFLGWMALAVAGLTAYYTFRVWFRVCAGPKHFEMGEEGHGAHGHDHGHDHGHGDDHGHGHDQPHAPRFVINFVLIAITAGAVLAAVPYFMANTTPGVTGGWVAELVADSSAAGGLPGAVPDHATLFGFDPHKAMYFVSAVVGIIGIAIAWYLHLHRREQADRLRERLLARRGTRWLPIAMERKWYVDEVYHVLIRAPLWAIGFVLSGIDRRVIDLVLVDGTARLPALLARRFQPLYGGLLHAYAILMAGGLALMVLLVLYMPDMLHALERWFGSGGGG